MMIALCYISLDTVTMSAFCAEPEYWADGEYKGLETSFNEIIEGIKADENLTSFQKSHFFSKISIMLSADERKKIPFGHDKKPTKDDLMIFFKGLIAMQNLVSPMLFHAFIHMMNQSMRDWLLTIPDGKEGNRIKLLYTGHGRVPLPSLEIISDTIPDMAPAPAIARHRRALAIMTNFIKIFKIMRSDKDNFDQHFDANIKEVYSVGDYNFKDINERHITQFKKFVDENWDELVEWDTEFKEMLKRD